MATPAPRKDLTKVYRSYAPQIVSGEWNDTSIRIAVAMHERGDFRMSARLIDAMDRDDRVISALETLILGILRLPFECKAANDTDEATQCRTALLLVWRRVIRPHLYDVCRWVVMGGFALVELDWGSDDPQVWDLVGFQVWHLQFVTWDETRKLFLLQTTDGTIEVDPKDLGRKFIIFSAGGDRPWMRGAVRSLGDDFLAHDETERDWSRDSEVHGAGILKAKTPRGSDDEPAKDRFVESVANLGSEPVVETPQGATPAESYDLDHMDTGKDHAAGFKTRIDHVIANINIRILGQNASTENSGPYVAKGGLFAKATLDRIDALVGPLEEGLKEGVGEPYADFNYGDAGLAPTFDYDSEPPQDKSAQAQTMAAVATAVATLKTAGAAVDYAELSGRYGFKVDAAADSAAGADFFAYDLEQGVITINEYRRLAKGMDPVPWGDQTAAERNAQLEATATKPAPIKEGAAA